MTNLFKYSLIVIVSAIIAFTLIVHWSYVAVRTSNNTSKESNITMFGCIKCTGYTERMRGLPIPFILEKGDGYSVKSQNSFFVVPAVLNLLLVTSVISVILAGIVHIVTAQIFKERST